MDIRQTEMLDSMLPLSAAERLFANRMIQLSGCSAYKAAFEARQRTLRGAAHDLAAVQTCIAYFRLNLSPRAQRRVPIRHLDRINIKRRARGLAPLSRICADDGAPHSRCLARAA